MLLEIKDAIKNVIKNWMISYKINIKLLNENWRKRVDVGCGHATKMVDWHETCVHDIRPKQEW